MNPVASSSTSKAPLPLRLKKPDPDSSAAGRIATSRFLTRPSSKSSVLSPREPPPKKSFLGKGTSNQDAGTGHEWVDQAAPIDLKGKRRAKEAPQTYVVPSRFMSASTHSKQSALSSSTSSRPPNPSLRSSASSSTRPKPRPPPLSTTASTRTTKLKPNLPPLNLPPLPLSPIASITSAATAATQGPGRGGAKRVGSRISDTSSLGSRAPSSIRGGSVLGQSARGKPALTKSTVAPVAEERAPSKPLSWLDLAHSLGSISIPPPPANPNLHTYAEFLFLLLGQVKLTTVLDESTSSVETILYQAKHSLAKAEEEVREEVERERLGKEIELLGSLLEPKIGHGLIPLLFDLHQAQQTYDSLLLDVSSNIPRSHHHSLPLIKTLNRSLASSLTTLSTLSPHPGSPLSNVLSHLVDRINGKLAVLEKVKKVVEGRRDALRKKVWEESLRRGIVES